ncbi:hypothetical protein ACH42_11835 [Endozoicomonas sp. (ex Bugula neritina AB1)]|nr:hypothetical protein ACH42_11835 [Endozoicomonas sp. (ex Bugula neritina AB1)]
MDAGGRATQKQLPRSDQTIIEGLQQLVQAGEYSRTVPLTKPKQQMIQQIEVFSTLLTRTLLPRTPKLP